MDQKLRNKILQNNINEQKKEAKYYDLLHVELSNSYEQNRLKTRLNTIINAIKKKKIQLLDVGAGTGNLCNIITKLPTDSTFEITALDISKEMQEVMNEKFKDTKIEYVLSDADSYLQENSSTFDLITISSVLHHLPDYEQTLASLSKHLNPGGVIYATHEPLNLSEQTPNFFYRLLNFADKVLQFIRTKLLISFGKIPNLKINYKYVDYHINERGIVPESLNFEGMKVNVTKYSVNYFVAPIANKLGYYNSFELILQKQK